MTIIPEAYLISYYDHRLTYIDDGVHKVCIVDYKYILGMAPSTETYREFWQSCYKAHLRLVAKQQRENAEREMAYEAENNLAKAVHKHYNKLS